VSYAREPLSHAADSDTYGVAATRGPAFEAAGLDEKTVHRPISENIKPGISKNQKIYRAPFSQRFTSSSSEDPLNLPRNG
jgi:hypothetical protein